MKVFTVGFRKKTAEEFFGLLDRPDVARVIDIRLHNHSMHCMFTMRQHLPFLLRRIIDIDYVEQKLLAPTKEVREL